MRPLMALPAAARNDLTWNEVKHKATGDHITSTLQTDGRTDRQTTLAVTSVAIPRFARANCNCISHNIRKVSINCLLSYSRATGSASARATFSLRGRAPPGTTVDAPTHPMSELKGRRRWGEEGTGREIVKGKGTGGKVRSE